MAKKIPPSTMEPRQITKKCPECFEYVSLSEEICPSCKASLGQVKKSGMAERPVNWKAYIICILAWLVLAVYIKWAFF
jgi:predicted amidophosphoribosyltransferase